MMLNSTAAVLSTLLLLPASGADAPWGRFRGPNGSGVATDATPLPDALGPEDNAIWRTPVPTGFSSPVLTADFVFITGVDGVDASTLCIDRATGEIVWQAVASKPLEKPHDTVNSPAAPTPVTDGENVYVFIEHCGGMISYDAEGELRWSVELGPFSTPYGMGTSPILAGDVVLLQCDHDGGSYLLALDQQTGKERWRTRRPGTTHGFSTPILYTPVGGPEQVIVSSSYQVAAFAVADGKKLWWVDGMAWQAKCVPVVDGDKLFVNSWMASPTEFGVPKLTATWTEVLGEFDADDDGSLTKAELQPLGLDGVWFLYDLDDSEALEEQEWGYALARNTAKNGLFAIQLGGAGDVTSSHVLWNFHRSLPNIPSPLVYDGLLYVLKEGGVLTALDIKTGESVKAGRVEGAEDTYYASPVAGDGKLITASHEGRVAVIEAGAEWRVLNVREFGEPIWATPAVGDGQVFIRTNDALYGFESSDT